MSLSKLEEQMNKEFTKEGKSVNLSEKVLLKFLGLIKEYYHVSNDLTIGQDIWVFDDFEEAMKYARHTYKYLHVLEIPTKHVKAQHKKSKHMWEVTHANPNEFVKRTLKIAIR